MELIKLPGNKGLINLDYITSIECNSSAKQNYYWVFLLGRARRITLSDNEFQEFFKEVVKHQAKKSRIT